jgi:hypothetical protein
LGAAFNPYRAHAIHSPAHAYVAHVGSLLFTGNAPYATTYLEENDNPRYAMSLLSKPDATGAVSAASLLLQHRFVEYGGSLPVDNRLTYKIDWHGKSPYQAGAQWMASNFVVKPLSVHYVPETVDAFEVARATVYAAESPAMSGVQPLGFVTTDKVTGEVRTYGLGNNVQLGKTDYAGVLPVMQWVLGRSKVSYTRDPAKGSVSSVALSAGSLPVAQTQNVTLDAWGGLKNFDFVSATSQKKRTFTQSFNANDLVSTFTSGFDGISTRTYGIDYDGEQPLRLKYSVGQSSVTVKEFTSKPGPTGN